MTRKNNIEIYSTNNLKTLMNKIYKRMTSISKNVCIDKSDDVIDKYNNTYHKTITMTPVDNKSDNYFQYNVNFSDGGLKFKVGDNIRISKYKNSFAKGLKNKFLKYEGLKNFL